MLKKNLVSFEPTTFSQKLTLYLPKTNSHPNRFFFELDTTDIQWGSGLPDQVFKKGHRPIECQKKPSVTKKPIFFSVMACQI